MRNAVRTVFVTVVAVLIVVCPVYGVTYTGLSGTPLECTCNIESCGVFSTYYLYPAMGRVFTFARGVIEYLTIENVTTGINLKRLITPKCDGQ